MQFYDTILMTMIAYCRLGLTSSVCKGRWAIPAYWTMMLLNTEITSRTRKLSVNDRMFSEKLTQLRSVIQTTNFICLKSWIGKKISTSCLNVEQPYKRKLNNLGAHLATNQIDPKNSNFQLLKPYLYKSRKEFVVP